MQSWLRASRLCTNGSRLTRLLSSSPGLTGSSIRRTTTSASRYTNTFRFLSGLAYEAECTRIPGDESNVEHDADERQQADLGTPDGTCVSGQSQTFATAGSQT